MSREPQGFFGWEEQGTYDLGVKLEDRAAISHEIYYEQDLLNIRDQRLYVGEPIPGRRYIFLLIIMALGVTALLVRAFWMQGLNHEKYMALSERNRLRSSMILSSRGVIRDRSGMILADNIPTFDVTVTPVDLPIEQTAKRDILGRVARISGVAIADLEESLASSTSPERKMVLVRDVPYEMAVALKIAMTDIPAFGVQNGSKRRYPLSIETPSFSHVLGYVGRVSEKDLSTEKYAKRGSTDMVGKTGIESAYDENLYGQPGEQVTEVDAYGREKRTVKQEDPVAGDDVVLSLDAHLQQETEKALRRGLEAAKVSRGSAVVMDPRDGSILAAVSWPAYDNNIFSGRVSSTRYAALIQDENKPLLARAWAGTYPSGSTIKPVYAAAALAEGVITSRTSIFSSGGLRIGSSFFPDWKAGGHGATDVRRAIAWSVNTFFYTICGGTETFKGLGIVRMDDWLKRFGFGQRLGLDVPGEASGFVPTPEWKQDKRGERWYVGDTYNMAIGQGDLLVTPLQIAESTAIIANGGFRVSPHLAANSSTMGERVVPPDVVKIVQAGMRDTVVYGSGRALANMPFSIAGKTGTAQWRNDKPNHAWFTAYAPANDPQVVVTVLLEEGVEGSSTAIPVAREIFNAWNKSFRVK